MIQNMKMFWTKHEEYVAAHEKLQGMAQVDGAVTCKNCPFGNGDCSAPVDSEAADCRRFGGAEDVRPAEKTLPTRVSILCRGAMYYALSEETPPLVKSKTGIDIGQKPAKVESMNKQQAVVADTEISIAFNILASARSKNSALELPEALRAKLTDSFETLLEWQDHVRKAANKV